MTQILTLALFLLIAAVAIGPDPAEAGGHIDAGVQAFAYGYELSVSINGVDLGLKGGKSEALRLKDKNHPWKKEMAGQDPERLRRIFVLEPGKNSLRITYRKIGNNPHDKMEFSLYLEPQSGDEPIYLIQDVLTDSAGKISMDFKIPEGDLSGIKPLKLK